MDVTIGRCERRIEADEVALLPRQSGNRIQQLLVPKRIIGQVVFLIN